MGPVDGESTGCKEGFGEGNEGKLSEMSNLCVKGGVSSNLEVEMTLAGGQTSLKWYSTIAVLSGTLAPAGTFLKNNDKICPAD